MDYRIVLMGLLLFIVPSIGYEAGFEGVFEEYKYYPLDLIARFLPRDPIIFEAGAYDGADSVSLSRKWPIGRVISFEPNPSSFAKFLVRTEDCPNVEGYNLAVNSFNGFATLNICYGYSGDDPVFQGASSLLEASDWKALDYQGPKVRVPCVVLDDWCRENKIERIDFMWLDLEGMELQLLKSSPHILNTVQVIYTETNFQPFRMGMVLYPELREFLENSGFRLLSHWYAKDYQGNAIFVRDLF